MMQALLRRFGCAMVVFVAAGHALMISGCTSQEEKCARLHQEITGIYNDYVAETSTMSENQMMSACDAALETCPGLSIAYELKGLVHWEADRLNDAWTHYRKALELAPASEETLEDAQRVAFSAAGLHIEVGEDGRVQTRPFKDITLSDYAGCPDSVRRLWCEQCERRLSNLPEARSDTVFVDQRGQEVGRMEFGMVYDVAGADDIDRKLLLRSDANPDEALHHATFVVTATGASYRRID
ncbi:hypothetical protein JCM14469_17630 [Desulfatiferula olefinivorans]